MKRELEYFNIEGAIGWNQNWFKDLSMYFGGCAAVTVCDLCIHMARQKGIKSLYPFDANSLNKGDYIAFSKTIKKYLGPRLRGVDTLELYISGLLNYWREIGLDSLNAESISGTVPWTESKNLIKKQIDSGMIVPFLLLNHKNRTMKNYQWHWFNLAGYKEDQGEFLVKAVTYGSFHWLNLQELWDTGYNRKGGIICIKR